MKKMQIIYKRTEDLKPYERNPRKNDEAVKYVKASIEEFGFKVPIVIDKDGVIVAGHTRWKAALELNMEELPCIMADDLTLKQIKAFRIADNKTAEAASWNFILLSSELEDVKDDIDLTDLNFSEAEIEGLLGLASDMGYIYTDDVDVDVDEDEANDNIYKPNYNPTIGTKEITRDDVKKAAINEATKFERGMRADLTKKTYVICPFCGKEFEYD